MAEKEKAMDYEKTVPFEGDVEKALSIARDVFISHSFEIVEKSESSLELEGRGSLWIKGQDPLIGISKIHICAGDGRLVIKAQFGGIRRAIIFLVLFIAGMALFFLIFFGITFSGRSGYHWWLSLAPFAPWPVIAPLMAKFLKYRTSRALDALVHNMKFLGKEF